MMQALLTGLLVGLFIAMPFGPVSLTCIRNAAGDGPVAGVMSSLGAASAHGIFAALAGIGAATITGLMADWQRPISLASAFFLILLGIAHLRRSTHPPKRSAPGGRMRPLGPYPTCLMLALSNPITILPYLAAAPSLAVVPEGSDMPHVLALALGAALGSCGWYLSISGVALLARRAVARDLTYRLDLLSGLALIGFGCAMVGQHA